MIFDIKKIQAVVKHISEAKQLSEKTLWIAIEAAFSAAYKREYAKSDQIIQARINKETGEINFFQVKQVLGEENILPIDELPKEEDETRVHFNPERHIMIEDAKLVRQGVSIDEEISFPLQEKTDFSRIAAQSARQAITQKIHEAERASVVAEFEDKEGTLVHGQVQRIEKGNVYIDLTKTIAILPFDEQIRGERFKQGDVIRAYVVEIDTKKRSGAFVKLSRASEQMVIKLFESEVPELQEGILQIKAIARDPGVRTKIAVESTDPQVDPIGAFVGQRGIRVMTVKSELGGEQIDIISWSENINEFIEESLLPADVGEVEVNESIKTAKIHVIESQIPVVIGKGGQNIKLASKLTDWNIKILNDKNEVIAEAKPNGEVNIYRKEEGTRDKENDKENDKEKMSKETEKKENKQKDKDEERKDLQNK